jgi:hypothetical protein
MNKSTVASTPRSAWQHWMRVLVLAAMLTGEVRAQNSGVTVGFHVDADWGAAANVTFTLTNTTATAIPNWTLAFDFAPVISPYSGAAVASQNGGHQVFTNLSYAVIPANGTLSFQCEATPGNLGSNQPVNYLFNGSSPGGSAPPVQISISDATFTAGLSGSAPLSLPVTLSAPAAGSVTVNYATSDGTAAAGQAYAPATGTLTFKAGVTQQMITVSIFGSQLPGPAESFSVVLSQASTNATIARGVASVTIQYSNSVAVTTYPDWLATNDIPTELGASNTLWEYVLGLDPNHPGPVNALPGPGLINGLLTLTYPRFRADIAYAARTSDDLAAWTTNGVTETTSGYQVTDSVPKAANVPKRFLSLQVTYLPYAARFLQHYANLHDPANGYFNSNGIPYHAVETLICEAPDYGHETTSEAYSYYLWLEAMYGRLTGDWSRLATAWTSLETHMIPAHADQPSSAAYNPGAPATYAPELDLPSLYPAALNTGAPVGSDPLFAEITQTYGTADLYGMHWILDVDNWYGFGHQADGTTSPSFFNTFQRGKMESVWETVPQPCWDAFRWGGPNGYLDPFTSGTTYTPQWKYTTAPDADARAIQAIYWAKLWADAQGGSSLVNSLVGKASRMGDCLRYAMYDKYFRNVTNSAQAGTGRQSCTYLLDWYYAWGGSTNSSGGWAWRIGCSHAHFGYQNPVTAWALGNVPGFIPASPTAQADWTNSLQRQLEFYGWLQSAEGGIAGGATSSWNGDYETPPAGTSTFHGMAYEEAPVYDNPPSNQWFGMQTWSMERLAEYYYLSNDPRAKAILDRWVAWVLANVRLPVDGAFAIPGDLAWSGQPNVWNPAAPGTNTNLHVTILDWNQDAGVTASLARALIHYSAATQRWTVPNTAAQTTAKALLDQLWAAGRDQLGVSLGETRPDYAQFFDQPVYAPANWTGHMPDGDTITNGVTFLGLRSKYQNDPAFPALQAAYNAWVAGGSQGAFPSPVYHYHRFWAQVEIAMANAEYDYFFPPNP